jgi:sugar O-acyltransferase (sialic acid O-acetyltransferase NeuD family)
MKRKIIIVGAGSVGGHVASNPELYGLEDRIFGFVDDDLSKQGQLFCGYKVIETVDWLLDQQDFDVIIGIAFPKVKQALIKKLSVNSSISYPSITSRNAWISNNCSVGKGSIIYPGTSINYGSVIGDFVVINMNCALGHHCNIGSFSSLAPGVNLGGHTISGDGVEFGIGCGTLQGIEIGKEVIIGGQAMVTNNIPNNTRVAGVPAKELTSY